MAVSRLQGLDSTSIPRVMATARALELGRAQEAATQIAPLLKSNPNHPEVLRLQAGLLNLCGDHAGAARVMQGALAQRPDDPLYHNTLGSILGSGSDLDGAVAALRRACELQPHLAIAWYNLGVMLTHCVRHAEAIEALRTAVKLQPHHMEARALLADMLRAEGRLDDAAREYRRIVAERPSSGMAWMGLANLKVRRFTASDVAQIRQALRDSRAGDDDLIALGFALAQALEDQGLLAESLDALRQANATARNRKTWNAEMFSRSISAMLDAFRTPAQPASDPALGREVIFIVGLPRSGSTLIEQILASHSEVQGAGELPDLPLTLTEESRRRLVPFPSWVAQAQPQDWERLGRRYLERTSRWRKERQVFIDKLPSNWMYLGAIRAMLPAAKIVACRRDPLETCFSCYRQYLANNEYTRTFADLAAFWRDYDRSIRQWRELAPEHLYEHAYEDLIADPESSIRNLLAFCGLPFEDACLRFHETRREVGSPSAMQVRQPLRADTARGPRYGTLLDPLRQELGLPLFVDAPDRKGPSG